MRTKANLGTLSLGASREARARERWRAASRLVSTRWDVFLVAEPERRALAFASYIAALDAEESAAVPMASLASSRET
jgi:hypothetical protein